MTNCPVGLGKAINLREPEIFHGLQGGWFHLFFQQNMSLSRLSASKFPSLQISQFSEGITFATYQKETSFLEVGSGLYIPRTASGLSG